MPSAKPKSLKRPRAPSTSDIKQDEAAQKLPFAMSAPLVFKPVDEEDDLDAQIAALERQLGVDGSGSASDQESSSSSAEDDDDVDEKQPPAAKRKQQPVKLVSELLEKDRIQPLPPTLLPLPGCGVPKAAKRAAKQKAAPARPLSSGLESAVKELLANYEPKSAERIPFYCRVCKFQGDSVEALDAHRQEPLHIEAAQKERKVSFCKLCRKQFTSPPQLQEHIQGKAHRDLLASMMEKQGKWTGGSSSSSSSSRGRGRSSSARGRGRQQHSATFYGR
jgi:Zinc-finger of C2H2 type